jgi:uncharacterized protein
MISPKKRRRPGKTKKRKSWGAVNYTRLACSVLLLLLLTFSLCVLGYVIFFHTAVAQEIPPDIASDRVDTFLPTHLAHDTSVNHSVNELPHATSSTTVAGQLQLPKVAIIIDDMGYDETIGNELLKFPIELTYSFLPFAPYTKKLERSAHRAGKTVFLHLPLQPKDSSSFNPGPGALHLQDSPETQREKLEKCLQQVPHAVGINNHMGSAFTEDSEAMTNIIEVMKARSLIFVDSLTTSGSVALQTARQAAVKSFGRSVFLDNTMDGEEICLQLEKLVGIAERRGWAIGIAHPHKVTVTALARCNAQYQTRVQYVGLTDILL